MSTAKRSNGKNVETFLRDLKSDYPVQYWEHNDTKAILVRFKKQDYIIAREEIIETTDLNKIYGPLNYWLRLVERTTIGSGVFR